jgi:hypothetical protein
MPTSILSILVLRIEISIIMWNKDTILSIGTLMILLNGDCKIFKVVRSHGGDVEITILVGLGINFGPQMRGYVFEVAVIDNKSFVDPEKNEIIC